MVLLFRNYYCKAQEIEHSGGPCGVESALTGRFSSHRCPSQCIPTHKYLFDSHYSQRSWLANLIDQQHQADRRNVRIEIEMLR